MEKKSPKENSAENATVHSKAKIIAIVAVILAVVAAAAVIIIMNSRPDQTDKKEKAQKKQEKEVVTVTPCDAEDEKIFSDSLIGKWSSYTKDGVAFTYSFDKDGTAHYKKDGENAIEYTYTFEDGIFTIKGADKNFAYLCSKDAVGMAANHHYGAIQTMYAEKAEEIPDFNGCVYISDDFMYLGTVCLCKDDKLAGFDNNTIEGDWLGVKGDTVSFSADGSYSYHDDGEEYNGQYSVNSADGALSITLRNKTDFSKDKWGIDGRVLHIDKQYYFKVV